MQSILLKITLVRLYEKMVVDIIFGFFLVEHSWCSVSYGSEGVQKLNSLNLRISRFLKHDFVFRTRCSRVA